MVWLNVVRTKSYISIFDSCWRHSALSIIRRSMIEWMRHSACSQLFLLWETKLQSQQNITVDSMQKYARKCISAHDLIATKWFNWEIVSICVNHHMVILDGVLKSACWFFFILIFSPIIICITSCTFAQNICSHIVCLWCRFWLN